MAHIIRLHGDAHSKTQSLLPWYANGTLDAEEAAMVEAHLSDCPLCRADLQLEQRLGFDLADGRTNADRGWAALRSRLDEGGQRRRTGLGFRFPAFLRQPITVGWALVGQIAAAAVLICVAGLSGLKAPVRYHTLSSPPGASSGNIIVMFRPTASEQQLRHTLIDSGARLVDGPTASDAYVLHVPEGGRAAALAQLKSSAQVVLAEPINGGARP